MEESLAKIRPHTSSSLAHQKAPANLLNALEATFQEQGTERTPAAYFAGLLTALESTVQKGREEGFKLGEGDLLPAELYLLALVAPHVPALIIRLHLETLLSLTSPLWSPLSSHAPPLRSQLSLYDFVLRALDKASLDSPSVKQSFATILQFTVDHRPKVRRRAIDLVKDILSLPPPPFLIHPYSERVGEWIMSTLTEVNTFSTSKQKGKNAEDITTSAIHLLAFIKPVLPNIPPHLLPTITTSLLSLPRLRNPYLSQSVYSLLSDLVSIPKDPTSPQNVSNSISGLLEAIMSSPPSKADTVITPHWIHVIGRVMPVCKEADEEACDVALPKVWKTVFAFLENEDTASRREAADTLASLTRCISVSSIDRAVESDDTKSFPRQIISQIMKSLDSIAFARAIPELLFVISSLISSLRYRPQGKSFPTAAELIALPLVQKIGDMRLAKGFEYKEAVDDTLRAAFATMGPEVILRVLPLNLEPEDRSNGKEPRAFLLPLLAHPHPSPLRHFITYFVPLSERMFDLQQKAEVEGRASEAKVWSVLVSQIWNGLPAYCYRTPDLKESLSPQFAQMLSQLLYNQPELRPPVLKALKVIVESNTKEASEDEEMDDIFTKEEIQQNKLYLQTQAESWFGVLFNLFTAVGRDGQGAVGDVISAWASVSGEKEMTGTCRKVVELFKTNLGKLSTSGPASQSSLPIVSNMQDILVLLVPHLSEKDAQLVFDLSLQPEVLKNRDNGVQKRAYKLLTKITQSGKIKPDAEALFAQLDEVAEETLAAAKKDRLNLFNALLEYLPSTSLHVIPSIIPETVLGTKEPSEKARSAAFELIVAIGHKMKQGGVVKRHKLNGMDEDDDMTETPASLQEYFTMLAGGLAGATPHMISATVTAISRLVFEFKGDISPELQSEIFVTMLVFVTSANREIVKSALGFVKLSIHSLPVELLRPHLKDIVPALLNWSHDHKNHFKDKVRHIFERMIRRFGWDDVYACAGEEESAKVLLNIKKRKDRAKRKKAEREEAEDESEEEESRGKPTTGDAFEDVLYDSESESEESDTDRKQSRQKKATKKQAKDTGARLRIDNDEPMDLLQGANSRITNARSKDRKKQDGEKFKTDEETGKMVIDDEDSDEQVDEDAALAGAAYKETLTSVDGFTRGPNGRVKFNKDTKKRRRENEENSDVEMDDVTQKNRQKLRKGASKLGQEFKAKRAGGDVKKGGVDPYAYLSLSQAAKGGKGKGRQSFTLTGRK